MNKFILTKLGGGEGYTLTDNDLWGLRDALYHGIDSGYLKDNEKWAKGMIEKISDLRSNEDKLVLYKYKGERIETTQNRQTLRPHPQAH
jgi:hypothetical protein